MKNKNIIIAVLAVAGTIALFQGNPDDADTISASLVDVSSETQEVSSEAGAVSGAGDADRAKSAADQPTDRSLPIEREVSEEDMVDMLEGLWGPSESPDLLEDAEAEEGAESETVDPVIIVDEDKTPAPESEQPDQKSGQTSEKITVINDEEENEPEEGDAEIMTGDEIRYEDGVYSVIGEYKFGKTSENIAVEMTVKNNIVKSVKVVPLTLEDAERELQELFAKDIAAFVVGEKLSEIPRFASVKGGSSVPNGFQDAVEKIRLEALSPVQNTFKVEKEFQNSDRAADEAMTDEER